MPNMTNKTLLVLVFDYCRAAIADGLTDTKAFHQH